MVLIGSDNLYLITTVCPVLCGISQGPYCRQYAFTEKKHSQSENLIPFTSRGLAQRHRTAAGRQRDHYNFRGKDDQSPCGWSGEMC